uniref:Uncharacterized protein n=2 Tax=Eukaryota TaxID=2759 RepID=A0A7S1T0W1_9CHLO|mmetsp:Transcript_39590/g.70999  ORF Transcript_39590/g.70999 Transcript_39590/m.70999 type:complete len:149 (+) Transcript_39590:106-552(+)
MALSLTSVVGLKPLTTARTSVQVRRSARVVSCAHNADRSVKVAERSALAASVSAAPFVATQSAMAAQEVMGEMALEVNVLGLIATALFIIIPTAFLLTLYIKSSSEGNVSGGFGQKYYTESRGAGKKKTNLTAKLTGKGVGLYAEDKK